MIIIGGATGSGKTSLSISVAKQIGGEIVSVDAYQIYKKLDIGTAKIMAKEMQGITHHMLDIVEPELEFSVAEYREKALNVINDIKNRGKVPVLVGGTGLYISSLIYDYDFGQTTKDDGLRLELTDFVSKNGTEELHKKLMEIDPKSAQLIHPNNIRRVMRALEVTMMSGTKFSEQEQNKKAVVLPCQMYAMDIPRDNLYQRINNRVETMFSEGLEKEVESLLLGGLTFEHQSMQAIGYKEWKGYFEEGLPLEKVYQLISQNSRNYAKRQITWFKHQYKDICQWQNYEDKDIYFNKLSRTICENYYVKHHK